MTGITPTPVAGTDAPALLALHATPEVAAWREAPDPGFPLHDDPDSTRFTIRADGEIAGLVEYGEELDPKDRSASIDSFLGPA